VLVDASTVLVAGLVADELLHALNSAAPPARARSWRRDTRLRKPAPIASSGMLVCSALFVIVGLSWPFLSLIAAAGIRAAPRARLSPEDRTVRLAAIIGSRRARSL